MKATHSAQVKFTSLLVRHCPKATSWHVLRLLRYGHTVDTLLSGPWTAKTERKYTRIRTKIELLAAELDAGLLITVAQPRLNLLREGEIIGVPTS